MVFRVAQHHDWPMFSATVDRSKKPTKKKKKQKNNASETSACTTSTPPKQETSLDGHQYAGGVHNMCQNENENVKWNPTDFYFFSVRLSVRPSVYPIRLGGLFS